MARGDIGIADTGGLINVPTRTFPTKAGESAILAGEPVKLGNTAAVYVIACVDGDPTTSDYIVGIAATDATHTSSADGYIDVYLNLPNVIWKAHPKTAGAANTQSEIDALMFKKVPLDLTSSKWTVDSAAADANANGVFIVGGNKDNDELHFQFTAAVDYKVNRL